MEIQALRLVITEDDLAAWLAAGRTAGAPVRELQLRLADDGMHVTGVYPTALADVPFETVWEPCVRGGWLGARLADLRVIGIPAGVLRGKILTRVQEASSRHPHLRDAVEVVEDAVLVDVDRVLANRGLKGRTNLSAVRWGPEGIVVQSAVPGAERRA